MDSRQCLAILHAGSLLYAFKASSQGAGDFTKVEDVNDWPKLVPLRTIMGGCEMRVDQLSRASPINVIRYE